MTNYNMNRKFKILIVDDEEDLCEILQFNLENEGFKVDVAYSSEEALKMDLASYHIFLLDIMMGNISGTKLAKMMKKDDDLKLKPIIFLTAKNDEMDKLIGFKIGADDYISKPFSVKEVSARVSAVLKRTYPDSEENEFIIYKDLKIDNRSKKLFINEVDSELTKKEFDIIYLLLRNIGRVFSRNELLDLVWQDEGFITDRTVDVNIRRIRKKIGKKYEKYIRTRSGYGYSFEMKDE